MARLVDVVVVVAAAAVVDVVDVARRRRREVVRVKSEDARRRGNERGRVAALGGASLLLREWASPRWLALVPTSLSVATRRQRRRRRQRRKQRLIVPIAVPLRSK